MKIYLIGMPGSGKSTLGKQLAQALQLPFVDLDAEIERREGKPVKEIFRDHGEEYFRKKESAQLFEWSQASQNFVMATGGGAPCFHGGIDTINSSGTSIFLNVSIEELLRRLHTDKDRPLLQETDLKERLTNIFSQRRDFYRQAHIEMQEPITVEQALKKITKHS